MNDSSSASEKRPTPLATKIGFALMAVALAWWFLYYAQWYGAFGLMRLKVMCIAGTTHECAFFQEQIKAGGIPVYSPLLWWAGCIAVAIGFFQARAKR